MATPVASTPPPPVPTADVLARIAAVAWTLEPLAPHERSGLLRDEASFLLDGLLVRVSRGEGALDVAIGEGLAALSVGNRLDRLGYCSLGDYARERLDIATGTALKLARLARALRARPLLAASVRRGEVTARQAETILPVAHGEAEGAWIERARSETVRALAAAVRAAEVGEPEDDEPFTLVPLQVPTQAREVVEAALALAGRFLGATTPVWRRVEVICEEYLGAHPAELPEAEVAALSLPRSVLDEDLAALKEGLEHEYRRWEALGEPARFEAPPGPCDGDAFPDPLAVDTRLRELAAMRAAWDALIGHLGMLVQNTGAWRHMGFASIGHYAEERLGMSGRAVEQRAAPERRLWALPALRTAMTEGRVSYEKARLVAGHAVHAGCSDVDALIARAEQLTCIALRRELEAGEQAQMCTRGDLAFRLPHRVSLLLAAALRAARDVAGRWLASGEAFALVSAHFLDTWKHELTGRRTAAQRAIERDGGFCQVPGCSRPAVQGHHVQFRSRGGSDDQDNRSGLCIGHHLYGIHAGWIRVWGTAPDALVWELPAPPAPLTPLSLSGFNSAP
jgi:hypothetical protein